MHLEFGAGALVIKGDSTHAKHKDAIPILAWSWGASNGGNLHQGGGGGGGKANVQDISITKYVDGTSNALLDAVCTGARVETATLFITNATGTQTDFLTIELSKGVLITSLSTGGSGGEDKLTENVTLHFGKFHYKFQPQDEQGAAKGGVKEFTYDMQTVAKA
jgi:type VI secretion system secreted protein Hcp